MRNLHATSMPCGRSSKDPREQTLADLTAQGAIADKTFKRGSPVI